MKYYAYFAFGQTQVIQQALFSILSIFQKDKIHERQDTKVIVFTDQPNAFSSYFKEGSSFLELVHTSMEEFKSMMSLPTNKNKNLHRVKLKCLERIFEMHPACKIILLDSDTYLLETLQPHFDRLGKETFMHKDEGAVFKFTTKPGLRSHRRFFSSHKLTVQGKPFSPHRDFRMFNAGVVGVSYEHAPLIKEMILIHDDIFEPTKYYNSEQFALSYILQTKTKLQATDDVIRHYWYLKEFQTTMEQFLKNTQNTSFKDLVNIKMPTDRMPSYEGFKKLSYNVPYKFKKKLFEKNLIQGPYVTFD